jgi:hypothetical protein
MKLLPTLLAPFALLLVLPVARSSGAVDPPPVTALDLEGVPRLEVPAPRRTLEPSRLRRPGAPPGWVVRIERERPANTPDDPRFDATPPPAVSGGRVFLGGGFFSRRLFALDARTGVRLWALALDDNGPSVVATPDGVITSTESCTEYSVDPATGRTRWRRRLGPSLPTPPAVRGRRILTCLRHEDGSYAFAALDTATGRTLWERPLARETVGSPVVAAGRIFLTLATREAVCLDEGTGETLWERQVHATSAPCLHGGGLYVATLVRNRHELARLDPADGRVVWTGHADRQAAAVRSRSTTGTEPPPIAPRCGWGDDPPRPEVAGSLVALGAGNEIVLFDAETGDVRRRIVLPEGRELYTPPARIRDRLLYATTDGLLLEVDLQVAAVRRALDLGVPVTSAPRPEGDRIYLTSRDLVLAVPWDRD